MEIIDIIHIVYQKIAHTESKMPRMIHQVAILIYQNGEAIRTITESENYFDRLIAVESCNLQFFFDKEKQSDDMEYHDNWMYCYFTEVCYEQAGIIYGLRDVYSVSKPSMKTEGATASAAKNPSRI